MSPELCHAELDRALSSQTFSKSARLRDLLRYIGTSSIEGRLDNLSEQQIGIRVFQRSPGYNTTEDTIVRVTARHLRERLERYYNGEGKNNPARLSVPKGSYTVIFENPKAHEVIPGGFALLAELPGDPTLLKRTEKSQWARWPLAARLSVAICVLLTAASLALVYSRTRQQPDPPLQPAGPEILWQALFTPGRKTMIVPGDAALDIYTAWEQKHVSLSDYTNQSYQQDVTASRPPASTGVPLGIRSMTPMADLRLVSELVRVPERLGHPQWDSWIEVCYARDMEIADTHNNNLILIGIESFNPWVTLYQRMLDFQVNWDYVNDVYTVTNRAPKPHEQVQFRFDRRTRGQTAYTLVALTDNVQGSGHVLLIEGTSMGTTYGAVSFLTNQHLWQPVIHAATDKSGKLHNFEVLLSNKFVRGGASDTQIVALHVH